MIWGAPGETVESFLEGYDRLARYVPRIATYPLILIPNTAYTSNRDEHGFVTLRGEHDDFEYVVANKDVSMAENRRMQRFLLWARGVAEHYVLRYIWAPLRELTDITQSQVLLSMSNWFQECTHPAAANLNLRQELLLRPSMVPEFLHKLYSEPLLDLLFDKWWKEQMENRLPLPVRQFLGEVFRYDWLTKPVYDPDGAGAIAQGGQFDVVHEGEETFYVRRGLHFEYDVPMLVAAIKQRSDYLIEKNPITVDIWYRTGFATYIDNHETASQFLGQPRYVHTLVTSRAFANGHQTGVSYIPVTNHL
jgi:hypothetical protein